MNLFFTITLIRKEPIGTAIISGAIKRPEFCRSINLLISICLFVLMGCTTKKQSTQFTTIPSSQSGIDFENTITETDQLNLITNEYTYMGGGVGIGDFNKDGLQDIFFSANQTSSRLYINKGEFKFED